MYSLIVSRFQKCILGRNDCRMAVMCILLIVSGIQGEGVF